jgi:two-component SAPR family response regulator
MQPTNDLLDRLRRQYSAMLTALEETVLVIKRGQNSLDRAIESSNDLEVDLAGPNVLKDDLIFSEPALNAPETIDLRKSEVLGRPFKDNQPMQKLQIRTFGRFEVAVDGKSITNWNNTRAKNILKLLVIHAETTLPQEFFVEALWPDQPVDAALNSLRVAIYELRKKLQSVGATNASQSPVSRLHGGYSLDLTRPIWIDCIHFQKLWELGRKHAVNGDLPLASRVYEEAIALYRGDFLDEDRYEEWTLIRRERLLDIYLTMLEHLADIHLQQGELLGCIQACQKILEKDLCHEGAYHKIIDCYLREGHTSRAIRWFEICRNALRVELDCEVSDGIMALVRPYQKAG